MERWVTKELVDYTMGTKFEDYPKEVIEKTKMLILDNIGCALGGSKTALGDAVITPFVSMGGSEEATIIGSGIKAPCIQAAFVNGTTANALDYDDTLLGIGHPGSSIIPAALAIGEWKNISGKDIMNAIITAFDVGDRIGLGIQPTYERLQKVWGVGTWQTFSAVIAAGKTLNLNSDKMINAFGVAGATAPLPNTQKWGWGLSERPIHWVKEPTGWPCWTGTLAAILADNGFIGNKYILDGDNGFWIMAGSDKCDYEIMTRGLGSEYEVVNNIAIKPYSSCRWQHAALDCIKLLKQKHDLKPEDVKEIIIHAFAWVCTHEVYGPKEMVDAQFCIPYTSTMIMMGYHPGPAWYTEENLKSEKIFNFSKKVKVKLDPELDKGYFEEDQIAARVEITTIKGDKLEKLVNIPSGDPRNPLSNQKIEDKFRNQALYSLEANQVERIIEKIYEFETIEDISTLMSLLAGV
jgi:2-methylcitrate dehydratase PrpD